MTQKASIREEMSSNGSTVDIFERSERFVRSMFLTPSWVTPPPSVPGLLGEPFLPQGGWVRTGVPKPIDAHIIFADSFNRVLYKVSSTRHVSKNELKRFQRAHGRVTARERVTQKRVPLGGPKTTPFGTPNFPRPPHDAPQRRRDSTSNLRKRSSGVANRPDSQTRGPGTRPL